VKKIKIHVSMDGRRRRRGDVKGRREGKRKEEVIFMSRCFFYGRMDDDENRGGTRETRKFSYSKRQI